MKDFVKQFRDLMGTPSTDPAVEALLEQFGIKARPKLQKGGSSGKRAFWIPGGVICRYPVTGSSSLFA